MATEILLPNETISASPGAGDHTTLDEGVDSPDGTYNTLDGNEQIIVGFPTPTGVLTLGAGLQTFRVRARRVSSTGGSMVVDLYESGSELQSYLINTSVTGSFVNYTATWDASSLADPSGANVQVRVRWLAGAPDLGIDAIDWIADYVVGQPYAKRLGGVPFMALNRWVF